MKLKYGGLPITVDCNGIFRCVCEKEHIETITFAEMQEKIMQTLKLKKIKKGVLVATLSHTLPDLKGHSFDRYVLLKIESISAWCSDNEYVYARGLGRGTGKYQYHYSNLFKNKPKKIKKLNKLLDNIRKDEKTIDKLEKELHFSKEEFLKLLEFKPIICVQCNERPVKTNKSLCKRCYQRKYYRSNRKGKVKK